jgi:hypothetical protein
MFIADTPKNQRIEAEADKEGLLLKSTHHVHNASVNSKVSNRYIAQSVEESSLMNESEMLESSAVN